MLQAVLFDLDGTLVDSAPDIAAAMNRSLVRAGLAPHPVESYRQMVGNGARVLTQRAAAGHPEAWEEVYRMYREDYSLNLLRDTRPYPGIRGMLEALRDAVRTDFFAADCWELEESGEALELIGIDPQDL